MYHGSPHQDSSIYSGTVPLPPLTKTISGRSTSSTNSRTLGLASTTQDPLHTFPPRLAQPRERTGERGRGTGEGVSPTITKKRNERPIPFTIERTGDPVSPSRARVEKTSSRDQLREEFATGSMSLKGIDWDERRRRGSADSQVQGLSHQSSPSSKPLENRSSTLSYDTISSTVSSRSSYSNRPSQPSFRLSHTRDPSSSTSIPSSKSQTHLLDFPLPSTSKTVRIRNRTSTLSLARTPSNVSSSSSSTNQSAREDKGKSREISEDWERGFPVLGPASPERKGMAMVDPRFTFPRRQGGGRLGVVGPMGELRRGSDESEKRRQARENSFVASLSSQPLLDRTGQILPLYSTSPPSQTTYLPTSPLQPSLVPPSPFSPTSPVHSIVSPEPQTAISQFLPYPFTSSSTSPATSKPRNPRSSSFTQRIRHRSRSNPRKPVRRRRSSSLRSSRSSNSSPRRRGGLRPRSVSTPDLRGHARSQSVPIPFDQFSPRSPYAHDKFNERRPSIADELLFGTHEFRAEGTTTSSAEVFPTRRYSMGDKGKGREGVSVKTRSRTPPLPIPPRSTQPRHSLPVRTKPRKESLPPNFVKGSLILPHPKLVVLDQDESESSEEGIRRRYAEGGRDDQVERILTEDSLEAETTRDPDQESLDHSSLLRVLRENEESRKEREGWSDSATKTLGFGSKLVGLEKNKRRGPGNMAFGGGGGGKISEERKKARKEVEKKKKSRAADSETEGEQLQRPTPVRRGSSLSQSQTRNGCSPPMPSSFEPFVQLGRKLSLSRTRSREKMVKNKTSVDTGNSGLHGIYMGQGSEGPGSTRTVRGKPIRHLRGSNSVDSIYSRTHLPSIARVQQESTDPGTQYGQALSFDDETAYPINEEHRRPSLTNQNAFLSLPPHLHHLLRSPERTSYEPSRAPPPPPPSVPPELRYPHHLKEDSNRLSTSSVASAARLSLALETQLLRTSTTQLSADPGTPTLSRTNARTPEITESRLNRSVSTPAMLCDSSNRSSPDPPVVTISEEGEPLVLNGPTPSRSPMPDSLSPVPALESPEGKRSINSVSTGSSGSNMDENGNWKELFFSPPRRQGASHKSGTSSFVDPSVSIMVASDDDSTDTDDTFSIRRLERTQRSLEALFSTSISVANNSENAQETLLPSLAAPSFARTNTEMSSAQASFVTAQETASDVDTETEDERSALSDLTIDPKVLSSRPLATPAQTPWASTSFAREYLDTLGGEDQPKHSSTLVPHPADLARSLSRTSTHSFLDLADEERPIEPTTQPSISPSSFLDDFSPPSSAPPSPALEQFPTPTPPFATTLSEPPSLPTSPTLSTTFDDTTRFSQIPTNRDSYLSVDSNNLHISPTAARFANDGRTHSHTSSNSNRSTVLGNFPIPPVSEEEDTGSDGDDEAGGGEDQEIQIPTSIDEGDDATLRLGPPSPQTPQRSPIRPSGVANREIVPPSEVPFPALTSSPTRPVEPSSSSEVSASFLDVSDPSDNESKRWSHQTFRTFYSSPKKDNTSSLPPPLPRGHP